MNREFNSGSKSITVVHSVSQTVVRELYCFSCLPKCGFNNSLCNISWIKTSGTNMAEYRSSWTMILGIRHFAINHEMRRRDFSTLLLQSRSPCDRSSCVFREVRSILFYIAERKNFYLMYFVLPRLYLLYVLRSNFHAFDACGFILYFYSWYFISLTTKLEYSFDYGFRYSWWFYLSKLNTNFDNLVY